MNVASSKIREWHDKPGLFVREVLRVSEVDDWQDEVLLAAAAGVSGIGNEINPEAKRRIALKASKGPGKSTVLAWLVWWFLLTRPHPKVVATSISGANLKDGLWTELSKWQSNSPLLKATFTWTAERIFANDHPETWWASARTWSSGANTEQQANTLAGIHADHVMFAVDEVGAVPDAVLAAAKAGLANADASKGRTALLAIAGNPTHLEGPLYRACERERALWWIKEISGDPDDPKRAQRVSIEWAREQILEYGRDHPYVRVNVLGKFPRAGSNKLIGLNDAADASHRELPPAHYRDEVKILGVDVARFGDDRTVFFLRQGKAAFKPRTFRNLDTMEVVGQLTMVVDRHEPDAVFIDQTGLGAGVVDRMRQLNYRVIGVDGAASPSEATFLNLRAEMWSKTGKWLRRGGCIPDDAELISELVAPSYRFNLDNKLTLESKQDLKKRGLPSPDKADALTLTFAASVAKQDPLDRHERRNKSHDYDPFQERP